MEGRDMKRAELVVGQEYYYARSTRWEENPSEGTKVTVVDTGHWEEPYRNSWSRANRSQEPIKVTKGGGILVDIVVRDWSAVDTAATKVVRQVAATQAIRGLYEETNKAVQERADARAAQYRADRQYRDEKDSIAEEVILYAADHGIKVFQTTRGNTSLSIDAADLRRLIEATKGS